MNKILLFSSLLTATLSFGQAQIVFNGAAYVVIDNSALVVVDNPATNAIVPSATGGFKTESEFDMVKWNLGTGTGNYVMPFVATDNTPIPFAASIATGGTVSATPGTILFSTYPGPTWDNNTYKPTGVTHMFDFNTATVNNSNHVIDRFWIVDAQNFSTKPSSTFSFAYRDVEHTAVGNSIVEADLGAQRFNTNTNQWGDYLPQGTTNAALNVTTGVPVVPANFFRAWTLSEVTNPLSVGLNYYTAVCSNGNVVLNWQTAFENETDHFEIERMTSNGLYDVVGFVTAMGGTNVTNYSYGVANYREGVFRLIEVSTDGNRTVLSENYINCGDFEEPVFSYEPMSNTVQIVLNSDFESNETFNMYDAAGRLIYTQEFKVYKGTNTVTIPVTEISVGIYPIAITLNGESFTSKILESVN